VVSATAPAFEVPLPHLRSAADQILSRLTIVTHLAVWNADYPSRPADALEITRRLVGDLVDFARLVEGLAPNVQDSSVTNDINFLDLRDTQTKTALSSIAGLIRKPWANWPPEQQARLAEQVLNACIHAVEMLRVRSIASADIATFSKRRLATVLFVLAAIFACGWQAYTTLTAPRHYAQRMKDFEVIRAALDQYRTVRGAYPVSSGNGERWNGIGWGGAREAWISGLVPDFVPSLPRDPRMSENPFEQYVYRSDGNDYKLLVLVADDCKYVVRKHPDMDDDVRNLSRFGTTSKPIRDCRAYGHWTPGAMSW